MGVHDDNACPQGEIIPGEELDDIQWLRFKYREVQGREVSLLDNLVKVLEDFDYRIRVLERKLKEITP